MEDPLNLVRLPPMCKAQPNLGIHRLLHIIAVQHFKSAGFPVAFPAGFSVEGNHNPVKNRCLPGSRIPGDQIEAVGKFLEINGGCCRIRAKGRHFKYEWLHNKSCLLCQNIIQEFLCVLLEGVFPFLCSICFLHPVPHLVRREAE